jgi:hypothetical protein
MDDYKLRIDIRHINVLAATILIINGISRLVEIPSRGYRLTFLNIQWVVEIDGRLLFMFLLALVVIAGSELTFRSHPFSLVPLLQRKSYSTTYHWILPGLSALGGSAAMNLFPSGPRWWFGLSLISGLLVLSVLGEYIVIDRKSVRYDLAAFGLRILGLVLLAMIFNAIHASGLRLAFALPAIGFSATIISLRLMDLENSHRRNTFNFALGIGLITSEFALILFFLPVISVAFSLLLTLSVHTLVGLISSENMKTGKRSIMMEYIIMDSIAILLILFLLGR